MGENSIRTMVLECYVIYVGWCRNKYHAPRWQAAQPENARIREVTCSHRYDLNFIHIEIYAFQLDVQNAKSKIGREAIWGEQSVLYTILPETLGAPVLSPQDIPECTCKCQCVQFASMWWRCLELTVCHVIAMLYCTMGVYDDLLHDEPLGTLKMQILFKSM